MAKFEPKNIIDTCLLDISGIFEVNQLIPEGNRKQIQDPIKPVAINKASWRWVPKITKIKAEAKHPNNVIKIMIGGEILVDKGIEMIRPSK